MENSCDYARCEIQDVAEVIKADDDEDDTYLTPITVSHYDKEKPSAGRTNEEDRNTDENGYLYLLPDSPISDVIDSPTFPNIPTPTDFKEFKEQPRTMKRTFRTLKAIAISIACVIVIVLIVTLSLMTLSWIKESSEQGTEITDCLTVMKSGTQSGIFQISMKYHMVNYHWDVGKSEPLKRELNAWCDMGTSGGGWLTILRRSDGRVNFNRSWKDYKYGFGDLETEFWYGNEAIHLLTNQKQMKLRFDLWHHVNGYYFAEYSKFSVGPANDNYRLYVSGFRGNTSGGDNFKRSNENIFITEDFGGDSLGSLCSRKYANGGGFWKSTYCFTVLMTGLYEMNNNSAGISWNSLDKSTQLSKAEMKIRPVTPHRF